MRMWDLYSICTLVLVLTLGCSQTTEEVEAAAKRGEPVERAVSHFISILWISLCMTNYRYSN